MCILCGLSLKSKESCIERCYQSKNNWGGGVDGMDGGGMCILCDRFSDVARIVV